MIIDNYISPLYDNSIFYHIKIIRLALGTFDFQIISQESKGVKMVQKKLASSSSTKISLEAIRNAATRHEFALLRGKTKDIIVHGVERHCNFDEEMLDLLKTKKLRLVAHTHPDYGITVPSKDDREFLKYIGQQTSIVISYITGNEVQFSANAFDDL